MRVATVCLAFAFAVLTALPDITGAPTSDVALASGVHALSESSELTTCEEEQEHVSQEALTATGTTTVDHSVKKKVRSKVSEKSNVVMYFVKSYKRLPKQKSCETYNEYCKRVFPEEDNLKVFYRRVFKCYDGEEIRDYTDRIEYIFTHVYPQHDCRLDVDWLECWDHYYTVKYCRKWDESDCDYYARILKKLDGECDETYKQRMKCLVAALDEEDFEHITFDDSELGYTVGERKTPCKSISTPESTAQVLGTTSTTVKSKTSLVDEDKSMNSVETVNNCGSSSSTENKLSKKETSIETETTTSSSAYKVAYVELPELIPGQSYDCYYKNFFGTYDDTICEDEKNELMLRMFLMYKHETCNNYIHRIDYLLNHIYCHLDVRYDKDWLPLTGYYWRLKCARQADEQQDDWFARVMLKEHDESAEHYKNKVDIIKEVCKDDFDWSLVSIDENCSLGYTLVSESEVSHSEKSLDSSTSTIYIQRGLDESCDEEEIKRTYAKKDCEDYSSYYQRLMEINTETTEDYIKTVTSIRKAYYDLALWYDVAYLDLTKKYYTELFTKQSCESHEQYFERIIKKYSFETDDQCAKRVYVLMHIFPCLEVWHNKVYYEKFTKVIYQSLYSKMSSENDSCYYERITQQLTGECDTAYVKRIQLIKMTHPGLSLWYNKDYLPYTYKYYKLKYSQGDTETITSYYERIVGKKTEETEDKCALRADMLHSIYPNLNLWHELKYYESYTKSLYQLTCSKRECEDDHTYYERITKQISGEADDVYTNRISLVKRTYCSLPLWYSKEFLSFTSLYYTNKYKKCSSESVDVYYKRIVEKEAHETDEQCANRAEIIRCIKPNLKLWHDESYYETLTSKIYATIYNQKSTEDDQTYYSRIVSQLPDESDSVYVQRMSLVKKTKNCLSLWYSASYIHLLSKYYTDYYAKRSDCEEWEDVYERIVAKEFDETDEQCAYRVEVIHRLHPELGLWYNEAYYVKYMRNHYAIIYGRISSENEHDYFSRICTKYASESELTYVGRLDLIIKTFPSLCLWHSSDYLPLLSDYIKTKYIQGENECDETYISRILAKADCDTSDFNHAQRIHLIHRLTVSSAIWYSENFYSAYLKYYYSTYFAKDDNECCEAWLRRVITQLDGECDEIATKRIALIKKSTSECGCWTEETFENIRSEFPSEYCEKLKHLFCGEAEYSETSMSSSSSTSESENNSEEIFISRG